MRRAALLAAASLLTLAACQRDNDTGTASADSVAAADSAVRVPAAPKMSAEHEDVVDRLNRRGWLRIPEVKAASDSFLNEVRTNNLPLSSAAVQFNQWLTTFGEQNPTKVQAAEEVAERVPLTNPDNPGTVENPQGGAPTAEPPQS